jgi:serine/threonine protein kinase
MTQVAQGLRFLNQYKIVHLDLKPENILLSKGLSVKIIDFGDAYNS